MVVLRLLLIMLLSAFFLYGYVDSDLDGVDDSVDKCPNTPFSDLVNESGCTIKSLVKKDNKNESHTQKAKKKRVKKESRQVRKKIYSKQDNIPTEVVSEIPQENKPTSHYDISLGLSKFGSGSIEENIAIDYYKGNFSLSLFSAFDSKRDYSESRFNDTKLWGYYNYKYDKHLHIKVGAGVVLPHLEGYDKKRVDAGLSIFSSYHKDYFNPYLGASYRFAGVDGRYEGLKDNYSLYGGAGFYLSNKLYGSFTYSYSSKEYDWTKDIKTSSLYFYYDIDGHWFSTASFVNNVKGLDYEHGFSLSVGYYF